MIRYSIAIDRDHDGDFGEIGGEISAQVIDLRWRLGMRAAYDSMSDYSWARITVRNPRGEFSPERNLLQSGTRLRIQSDDGTEVRTHFTGAISHVEPDEGVFSRKQAVIHLQDILPWLQDSPARLAPQIDVTADQVIGQLLDQSTLRRPALAGFCLIDVPGYSLIDSIRIFPAQNVGRRLQRGKTRFAYVGDWWRDSTPAREAIGEIVASERGRFFVDRLGEAVFLNRHHTLVHKTVAARFHDDMSGMQYSYGDQRLNQISLLMTPREIGESGVLLWQLRGPQRIGQRSELTMNLRLVDERDQPVGILEYDDLVARFQLAPETGGQEVRENVEALVVQLGASSAQVRISNRTRRDLYLTALQLYGKPLYRSDPLEIQAADGPGMHIYGLKRLALDLPALSDIETAQAFAAYEVTRRRHPQGAISELSVNARDHLPSALSLNLFDRIRVSETQTGHSARDYFIIGEQHHVSSGGARHDVIWTLEPADSTRFVIVDDSVIDNRDEVITPY